MELDQPLPTESHKWRLKLCLLSGIALYACLALLLLLVPGTIRAQASTRIVGTWVHVTYGYPADPADTLWMVLDSAGRFQYTAIRVTQGMEGPQVRTYPRTGRYTYRPVEEGLGLLCMDSAWLREQSSEPCNEVVWRSSGEISLPSGITYTRRSYRPLRRPTRGTSRPPGG